MTLPEFFRELNNLIAEIGDERVNSHYSLIPSLHIVDEENNNYEIDSLEPQLLFGCNCWAGVTIFLKKKEM
jgi:hypothetical protein